MATTKNQPPSYSYAQLPREDSAWKEILSSPKEDLVEEPGLTLGDLIRDNTIIAMQGKPANLEEGGFCQSFHYCSRCTSCPHSPGSAKTRRAFMLSLIGTLLIALLVIAFLAFFPEGFRFCQMKGSATQVGEQLLKRQDSGSNDTFVNNKRVSCLLFRSIPFIDIILYHD